MTCSRAVDEVRRAATFNDNADRDREKLENAERQLTSLPVNKSRK